MGRLEFKGEYTFNKEAVDETVSIRCIYGGGFVKRKCYKDAGEVKWEDLDLSQCRTKFETTQRLIELGKVQYIIQVVKTV